LIEKWRSYGGDLKSMTPVEFAAFLKTDHALWGQAIRQANLKIEN
jgi:hypothetical protein